MLAALQVGDEVVSIGVGTPGSVNKENGYIEFANNLGFDQVPAKEMLEECECDEEEQIKNLLEGKYAYRLTQEKGTEKVYAALVRKGFSYSAVRSAMKKYIDEQEICEEF